MSESTSSRGLALLAGLLLLIPLLAIVIITVVQEETENECIEAGGLGPITGSGPLTGDGFTVVSLNVLGHSHTIRGPRSRMGSGPTRMRKAIDWLRTNDVAIAGLQEFQPPQRKVMRSVGTEYSSFPGPGASRQAGANSIVWRSAEFELIRGSFVKVPYFRGKPWPMPVVVLRVKATGQRIIFMNVHNPADAHGPAQRWRDRAEAIEKRFIASITKRLGAPAILTGDFNARLSTVNVGMRTAAAGNVDFVFVTDGVKVQDSKEDRSVKGKWTDHPAVLARLGAGDDDGSSNGDPGGGSTQPVAQTVAGLDRAQTANATTIVRVGKQLGVPERGLVVALAAALQESGLRNLDYGDRDSLGLFQQRPSTGWGTPAQIRTPELAAAAFFGRAKHTGNNGLLDIAGWKTMSVSAAAQAVQASAYPSAYADDEEQARQILAGLDGVVASTATASAPDTTCSRSGLELVSAGGLCAPTDSPAEKGLTPDALMVLRCVDSTFGPHTYGGVGDRSANPGSDHPFGRAVDVMIDSWTSPTGIAEGSSIASWLQSHHKDLGVKYLIWRGRIWSPGDRSWRPYSHPSGASDPTSLHMDHVHVSVFGNAGTGLGTDVTLPLPAGSFTDQDNFGDGGAHWASGHTGDDLSAPCGTPVLAAHTGRVDVQTDQPWAGPHLVTISAGRGQVTTWYAHMQSINVQDGQLVRTGQQIGAVGSEGNSTGCHLHFEVHTRGGGMYDPDNVDPLPWVVSQMDRA